MRIRKAVVTDIRAIHAILKRYADEDLLLPRALSELYDQLRDYFVLEADRGGVPATPTGNDAKPAEAGRDTCTRIQGVCGLHICWEDLAEIKSLAVCEEICGQGHGVRLVDACLDEARALGLRRVFALTYIPEFFQRLGFQAVEKSVLPHKIWADCLKCPKFPDCGETALVLDL